MKVSVVRKMIIILFIISLFVSLISNISNAAHVAGAGGGAASTAGFDWRENIEEYEEADGDSNVVEKTRTIAGTAIVVTKVICLGVAIMMLLILGIKYITSSPNDRATVMKHAVVYVVGAIVMFASSGILSLIQQFATGFNVSS